MPLFLGHQCWCSIDDKTLLPGAKSILIHCVCADFFSFFFETLKECIPGLFYVLCSDIKLH